MEHNCETLFVINDKTLFKRKKQNLTFVLKIWRKKIKKKTQKYNFLIDEKKYIFAVIWNIR